jgi:hypothetical protein
MTQQEKKNHPPLVGVPESVIDYWRQISVAAQQLSYERSKLFTKEQHGLFVAYLQSEEAMAISIFRGIESVFAITEVEQSLFKFCTTDGDFHNAIMDKLRKGWKIQTGPDKLDSRNIFVSGELLSEVRQLAGLE